MAKKKLSAQELAAVRSRAQAARNQLAARPAPDEFLTRQELADAAPFYFVLREYIRELKTAREVAGLTLAEVSEISGLAVESLSRLETGAQTNPTWKTLGLYASAVKRQPVIKAAAVVAPQRYSPIIRCCPRIALLIPTDAANRIGQSMSFKSVPTARANASTVDSRGS